MATPWSYFTFGVTILMTGLASADRQSFAVVPVNTTVLIGQNTVLTCRVANLKGLVQWSKNGILLGYNPVIPGFNGRYKITGNSSAGVFDLSISDVLLADEAAFQCQVTPAGGDPPLVASAYLTVSVLPQQVYIQGSANGSLVGVPVGSRLTLNLTCWSRGSKPRAVVTWLSLRNGMSMSTMTSGNFASSTSGNGMLFDSWSTLSLTNTGVLKSDVLTCRSTLIGSSSSAGDVTIGIVIPSRPQITGYTTGDLVTPNQRVTLNCISKGASSIYWYQIDLVPGDSSPQNITSTACGDVTLTSLLADSQCVSQIVITAQPSDNTVIYGCAAVYDVTGDVMIANPEVQLTVLFKPQFLHSPSSVASVAEKGTLILNATAVGNPTDVTYRWIYAARQPGDVTPVDCSTFGLMAMSSRMPLLILNDVTRGDCGTYCCAASNSEGLTWLSFVVDVRFSAEVTNSTPALTVAESTNATLECSIVANPIGGGTVTWSLPSVQSGGDLQSRVSTEFDPVTGTSILRIVRTSLGDSGDYRCIAFNGIGTPVQAIVSLRVGPGPQSNALVRSSTLSTTVIIVVCVAVLSFAILLFAIVLSVSVACMRRRRHKMALKHLSAVQGDDVSDETSVNSQNSRMQTVSCSGESSLSTATSTLYYSDKKTCSTLSCVPSSPDLKPVINIYCNSYSPIAAAAACNLSRTDSLHTSDSFSPDVHIQLQTLRDKPTSAGTDFRWGNHIISECAEEASYIERLRELQRFGYDSDRASVPVLHLAKTQTGNSAARCHHHNSLLKPSSTKSPGLYNSESVDRIPRCEVRPENNNNGIIRLPAYKKPRRTMSDDGTGQC